MKILLLDTETSPNTAFVWGLFNENIPLARLIDTSEVLYLILPANNFLSGFTPYLRRPMLL